MDIFQHGCRNGWSTMNRNGTQKAVPPPPPLDGLLLGEAMGPEHPYTLFLGLPKYKALITLTWAVPQGCIWSKQMAMSPRQDRAKLASTYYKSGTFPKLFLGCDTNPMYVWHLSRPTCVNPIGIEEHGGINKPTPG